MDLVLGGGIVGLSVALALQRAGREVIIIERGAPGGGTSFGNAGLIEMSDLSPRTFPRGMGDLWRYGTGQDGRAVYRLRHLPGLAPFLMRYWHASRPANVARVADAIRPLFLRSLGAHKSLAAEAGATDLWRDDGWVNLYRGGPLSGDAEAGIARARAEGLTVDLLDRDGVRARFPMLTQDMALGVHWRSAASLIDPGAYSARLAALFVRQGGTIVAADAQTLRDDRTGWSVAGPDGRIDGERAVVALGPWSGDLVKRFGYRIPLAAKRGYHMHYAPVAGAVPDLPLIDMDNGYVLNPMARGIRLTTAIEFAPRDAPPDPRQLGPMEAAARALMPLGEQVDTAPWMGSRPTTADMMPVIGPAQRHKGLWLAFGHAHHGLTLGPVTGEIVAAEMTGAAVPFDASAFSPARFG